MADCDACGTEYRRKPNGGKRTDRDLCEECQKLPVIEREQRCADRLRSRWQAAGLPAPHPYDPVKVTFVDPATLVRDTGGSGMGRTPHDWAPQVVDYLEQNGPTPWVTIYEALGVPRGSASVVRNRALLDRRITHDPKVGGLWRLRAWGPAAAREHEELMDKASTAVAVRPDVTPEPAKPGRPKPSAELVAAFGAASEDIKRSKLTVTETRHAGPMTAVVDGEKASTRLWHRYAETLLSHLEKEYDPDIADRIESALVEPDAK